MAKGTVTNEIQYRGFNTVRMNPGDSFDCYEFFVKAGDYISHSFAIYSVSPLAGAVRARTRFIGTNGLTISTSSHTVTTTGGTFDEVAIEGVPVPAGARLGRLELLSPSGTYWVAMPKSEDGEKATPYSQNYSGQMTYITPTGVYTGTIQANQINLTSGGDLEDSMTTINNKVINMTSSVSALNASVTNIQAGQAEFVKISDIDGSKSTTIIDGGTIKTGTITALKLAANAVTAAKIASNAITAVKISSGAITTAKLAADAVTADKIAANAITAVKISSGAITSNELAVNSVTADKIAAGAITADKISANAITANKFASIAGFTFSNSMMVASNSGSWVRISGNPGSSPIAVGPSSSDIRFRVGTDGSLVATSATVTGNITANSYSTLGGSLNSTSGTHSGGLYNTTGRHNGTHYGYQSGTADNYSGTFGGVPYQGYSGTLVRMNGSLTIDTGYLSCNRTLYANGGIVDGSDIHYKKDIHQKDNSSLMNEIYNLDVVSFKYKDNNKDSIGVIANNMVLESPTLSKYMVEPNPEGYLSVNYTSLNTASILAIQDLNKRLEKIERAMA